MFKWKSKEVKSAIRDDMSLEQVRVGMVGLMGEENTNHHRMGQLYNHVVDKKLAQAAGFKDAEDFIRKVLPDLSYSALRMYGAVAKAFSEQTSLRFGVTCLYLLLIYKKAVNLTLNDAELSDTVIEVPDAKGAVTSTRFGDCSVEQMRQAIQRKRKPSSSKAVSPEAVALAEQYQAAVTGLFPKGALVKVQVRNEKGKAVLDFRGIPVEDVGQLAAMVTAARPPMRRVRRAAKASPTA